MEHSNELSSSFSLPISSQLCDNASSYNIPSPISLQEGISDDSSVGRLSLCLEKLLLGGEYDQYHDAEIKVEGVSVGVNRGILAARSQFFHDLFSNDSDNSVTSGKQKHLLSNVVPYGRIGYEAFIVVLYYLYTGKFKDSPTDVSMCVDDACAHGACGPAIDHTVQLMYASFIFQIPDLVMVVQRRLFGFVHNAFVEDVIPILRVAFQCQLKPLLDECVLKIARSDLDNIVLEKELPCEIWTYVDSKRAERPNPTQKYTENEKKIRKIHKALHSEDLELVNLLLAESTITLDSACALHYAAAYCNSSMIDGLLKLKNANVNLRNSRGDTVLHVAARRKDPSILIKLLHREASVFDTTRDGLTSVSICRRLTRVKDFNERRIHCQNTHKDRLCIDMLEGKLWSSPCAESVLISAMIEDNDLYMKLLYFENRVSLAHYLFPSEAKLAMQVAEADSISESLTGERSEKNIGDVDQIAITTEQVKRQTHRLLVLKKTVNNGRNYFPNCSKVLDKFLEDEILGSPLLDEGSPEEIVKKRARYMEITADVMEALHKDKALSRRSAATRKASRK